METIDLTALTARMIAFDRGDARRIQHFIKVHAFAALIGRLEKLPADVQQTLEAAAIVHDIGIHAAEEKYGSTGGKYQETEGAPLAETMLHELGASEALAKRVSFLVGHHHTYSGVDGADYQILLEADFLVNAYEDHLSKKGIRAFGDQVFRTAAGKQLLEEIFAPDAPEKEEARK